jgi:acyl dehydratase
MESPVAASELVNYLGQEVGVSDWLQIDQDRINKFAEATGDYQYIHIDPERAAATPFGSTIAHGFLTLSLLTMLGSGEGRLEVKDTVMAINYGLDRVRFITPVKVGSKIRAHFTLQDVTEKQPGRYLIKHHVVVEIAGEDKPAMIADWLGMTITS